MIPPVTRQSTQSSQNPQKDSLALRVLRVLRSTFVVLLWPALVSAHDLERTRVVMTFAADGSFVLDVANDPAWLKERLATISGNFADRVVMWVDGREVRPTSVEYLPTLDAPLGTHRLRGRMPLDARTLRWYYGLVADPYPLAIRRADGRVIVEEVGGDAWSGTIDLSGQFHAPLLSERLTGLLLVGLLFVPIAIRLATKTRRHEKE
jgi:hypothetical protein